MGKNIVLMLSWMVIRFDFLEVRKADLVPNPALLFFSLMVPVTEEVRADAPRRFVFFAEKPM
jgi:hypothetical protein